MTGRKGREKGRWVGYCVCGISHAISDTLKGVMRGDQMSVDKREEIVLKSTQSSKYRKDAMEDSVKKKKKNKRRVDPERR